MPLGTATMPPAVAATIDLREADETPAADQIAARTLALLPQLTLPEKVALLSGQDFWSLAGVPRLGLAGVSISDGPHGLRKQRGGDTIALTSNVPATCFPTASALASTWDRELLRAVGTALGEEARAEGVGVLLGPGSNIKRSPLCGRNFEYFSEDPYLSGALAAAYIQGVQGVGIGAALKHFAANNQETRRFVIDAIIDERALREIYLASFELAVKEGRPWAVMAAYNRLNGTYCAEHRGCAQELSEGKLCQSSIRYGVFASTVRVAESVAATHIRAPCRRAATARRRIPCA